MDNALKDLLQSAEAWDPPEKFNSCWNSRGEYHTLQFVLRLRPDIHRALSSGPHGLVSPGEVTGEQIYAFSTYLHETIHWWQHVGSTSGLILSLLYPAHAHINHQNLKKIVAKIGAVKPLIAYGLQQERTSESASETDKLINVVVNNWHDIEFYRRLIVIPNDVTNFCENNHFECVGHAYEIAIGAVNWLISATMDPDLEILPDPRKWESETAALKAAQVEGFYYRSPIGIPPVGAKEIFEGQARFSQLQYLFFSSGGSVTWQDFDELGMLQRVYIEAFEVFLSLADLGMPEDAGCSEVGLFLLVCDVALNPADGIVTNFEDLSRLIEVHDPGIRFVNLCKAICSLKSTSDFTISHYSADEFWRISSLICKAANLVSPKTLIDEVASWPNRRSQIEALMEEDRTFHFSNENLPVRVFMARFIKYQIDKQARPEFFCWPGAWMTAKVSGASGAVKSLSLFEEHRALFLDKEDGDVYPRTFEDRAEDAIKNTFDAFYSWVPVYELTRQWIIETGDFVYDFLWLSSKHSHDAMKRWASGKFEEAYGFPCDAVVKIAT